MTKFIDELFLSRKLFPVGLGWGRGGAAGGEVGETGGKLFGGTL